VPRALEDHFDPITMQEGDRQPRSFVGLYPPRAAKESVLPEFSFRGGSRETTN
jgi:hypothetical protein